MTEAVTQSPNVRWNISVPLRWNISVPPDFDEATRIYLAS